MKRWTLRITICLILGAMSTVAVAWGCAAWMPLRQIPSAAQNYLVSQDEALWWARCVPSGFTSRPVLSSRATTWGIRAAYVSADRTDNRLTITSDPTGLVTGIMVAAGPPVYFDHAMYVRSGWPMSSFEGARWILGWGQSGQTTLRSVLQLPPSPGSPTLVNAIAFDRSTGQRPEYRIIPTAVVPIGFAVNMLFYAAIWGGVWFGFVGGKRFIRSKRGRCPRCAYDLRGQVGGEVSDQRSEVSGAKAGCPECGWGRESSYRSANAEA